MKHLALLIILSIGASNQLSAQSQKQSYEITLDPTLSINKNHPYIEHLATQDEEYITWLYVTNKINMKNTPEYADPAVIIDDSDGNNSLIFTLTNDEDIRYDTLRNSIHDHRDFKITKRSFLKRWFGRSWFGRSWFGKKNFDRNLTGNLPEQSMMWFEDKNWGLEFGVLIPENQSHVTILISDENGEKVTTIIGKKLRKGWNNFKWKRGHHPHGIYNISVSIDDQTMTQNFES